MTMRSAFLAALFGSTALIAASAIAQTTPPAGSDQQPAAAQPATPAQATPASAQPAPASAAQAAQAGPADLCQELLAYAEK
jgi:hypothetical protein